MNKELIIISKPALPEKWDYNESVKIGKQLFIRWKDITIEIAAHFHIAREMLIQKGGRPKKTSVKSRQFIKDWGDYCQEVSSIENKKNARDAFNRILNRFFPKELAEHEDPPPLPEGKYFVIYADPPWQYSNIGFDESAEQQYPTMPVNEICALPIKDLVDKKAALFLWVTNAFLRESLEVCEAWGFEYKTNFVWIKNTGPSIGWFSKSRHEMLFVATKGDGVHPAEKFNSWFEFKVGRHSQKPPEIYGMIEKMYSGPYIELFAREKRKGWDGWGNELT